MKLLLFVYFLPIFAVKVSSIVVHGLDRVFFGFRSILAHDVLHVKVSSDVFIYYVDNVLFCIIRLVLCRFRCFLF